MGISKIGAISSLPDGTVRRVAAGYAPQGFAGISGTFPAGKYLVKSNVACRANFTSGEGVPGYESAAFNNGDDIIVNVPRQTNFIEYQTFLDVNLLYSQANSQAAVQTAFPNNWPNAAINPGRKGIPSANGVNITAFTTLTNTFGYKGTQVFINNAATNNLYIRNSYTSPTPTLVGTITGATAFVNSNLSRSATNGTRVVGPYNTSQVFYTDNPLVNTGWALATPGVAAAGGGHVIYGGDKFIQYAGSASSQYSFDGVTWTALTLPAIPTYNTGQYGIAYGNGIWVLFPNAANNFYTSTDGITWTTRTIQNIQNPSTATIYGRTVVFGNGRFLAIANNVGLNMTAYGQLHWHTSIDGINWTRFYAPLNSASGATTNAAYIGYTGTTFHYGDANGLSGSQGYMSFDGLNWFNSQYNTQSYQSQSAGYTIGTRGRSWQYVGSTDNPTFDHFQENGKFEIYLLDSSYQTYSL